MLKFRRRDGYKTRCPGCGKIVRLQPSEPSPAEPTPPLVDAPEWSDYAETFENEPEAKMTVVVEEDEAAPFVQTAEESSIEISVATADEPPWTWQWLAVVGGLLLWEGFLSILAWLWWQ
jgi:hypothetical protein